jgi:hypothetical protein
MLRPPTENNSPEIQEPDIETFKQQCPKIYEQLTWRLPWKLVIEVPEEYVNTAEALAKKSHETCHPGSNAPFVSVDVAELLRREGISPEDFSRDLIYAEATRQLASQLGIGEPETSNWPLEDFEKLCDVANSRSNQGDDQVLLFIKNFDTVTSQLNDERSGHLILTTMRVGDNCDRCLHVTSLENLKDTGGRLNDARIAENIKT